MKTLKSPIYISNVFHLGNIRPRRLANAPRLYPPRLDFVCFRISPTVTWLIESTECSSTILSASKRTVQRAAPSGGSLQANMPNVASPSPVNCGGALGQPCHAALPAIHPKEKSSHIAHRVFAAQDRISTFLVRALLVLAAVVQKQDTRSGRGTGRSVAGTNPFFQLGAFFTCSFDMCMVSHVAQYHIPGQKAQNLI